MSISGAVMVSTALFCLVGAVHAKRVLGCIGAGIMSAAMIDVAWLEQLPAPLWGALLCGGALLLALELRLGHICSAHFVTEPIAPAQFTSSQRQTALIQTSKTRQQMVPKLPHAVVFALTYLATAYLVVTHGRGPDSTGTASLLTDHSGHSVLPTLQLVVLGGVALLGLWLFIGGMRSLRARSWLMAGEFLAMSTMLMVMLLHRH